MMRRLLHGFAALAWAVSACAFVSAGDARADESWATLRAAELCSQGDTHRDGGQVEIAVERYRQALEIDPTYGPAYLALGRLREATGDADEAERTYAAGIDHVTGFAEGYLARGALLLRAARGDDALTDLSAALSLRPADMAVVRRVRDASIALGKLPMALGAARRLVELAASAGDAAAEHEGRITVRALVEIVGFIDPVAEGGQRNEVRRALSLASGVRGKSERRNAADKLAQPERSRSSATPEARPDPRSASPRPRSSETKPTK